jgi:hypothetical protein
MAVLTGAALAVPAAGASRSVENDKFRITLNFPDEVSLRDLTEGELLIESLAAREADSMQGQETDDPADAIDLSAGQGVGRAGQVQAFIYTPLGPATVASRPFRFKVDGSDVVPRSKIRLRYRVTGGRSGVAAGGQFTFGVQVMWQGEVLCLEHTVRIKPAGGAA